MASNTLLANHFKNITIIHIPPYSPELKSIEQVWQWLRQYKQRIGVLKTITI
ncbi:hypothetical protein CWN92_21230 [Vibrio splendidus]|nr:hypothetical protein CWN92_21230 [Vibrio splendidus]